jgi:tRNA(adenine34) deaminase
MISPDEAHMREALQLAARAGSLGEVPVGAVAVHAGAVVGRGFNRRETERDPFAHAEMRAMAEAARALGAWRLTGVSLFVTLEPCAMCAGAMVQARIERLVFGARDPKAGAVGSLYNLLEEPRHNHRVQVSEGLLAEECGRILSAFFQGLRERRRTIE